MSIHTQSNEVKQIALAAFPDYNGRHFSVDTFRGPMRLDSCWEGGSRDYYVILNLATMRQHTVQENGTPFSNGGQIMRITELPLNCAVVEHSYFCGKDMGIRIYVNAENLAKLLPDAQVSLDSLTAHQQVVLVLTRSLKSFARLDYAQRDFGLSKSDYDQAKAELIAKGLLRSNGSITDEGRNIAGSISTFALEEKLKTPAAAAN